MFYVKSVLNNFPMESKVYRCRNREALSAVTFAARRFLARGQNFRVFGGTTPECKRIRKIRLIWRPLCLNLKLERHKNRLGWTVPDSVTMDCIKVRGNVEKVLRRAERSYGE